MSAAMNMPHGERSWGRADEGNCGEGAAVSGVVVEGV